MPDFTSFIKAIWRSFGSIRLSIWLIYALFADMLAGSIIMKHYPKVFFALNDMMLQQWAATYGLKAIQITWWFFVFLSLLFFLTLNTIACSTEKAVAIIEKFHGKGIWKFSLRLSPTIIHFGFVLLLLGQLVSHTLGVNSHGNILGIGTTIMVPKSNFRVTLKDLKLEFFKQRSPFLGMQGRTENVTGTLAFLDRSGVHEKAISMNHPVRYGGWGLFIEDFYPRKRGMTGPPFINLVVRKDPGAGLMEAGAFVFGLGLFMYLLLVTRSRTDQGNVSLIHRFRRLHGLL